MVLTTVTNVYAHNDRTLKYMSKKGTELKEDKNNTQTDKNLKITS